jgi:hypothetical protein
MLHRKAVSACRGFRDRYMKVDTTSPRCGGVESRMLWLFMLLLCRGSKFLTPAIWIHRTGRGVVEKSFRSGARAAKPPTNSPDFSVYAVYAISSLDTDPSLRYGVWWLFLCCFCVFTMPRRLREEGGGAGAEGGGGGGEGGGEGQG